MKELIHDIAISGLEIRELLDIVKSNLEKGNLEYKYGNSFYDMSRQIVSLNQNIKNSLYAKNQNSPLPLEDFLSLQELKGDIVIPAKGEERTINILSILTESLDMLEKIINQAYLAEDENRDENLTITEKLINELLKLIGSESSEIFDRELQSLTIEIPSIDKLASYISKTPLGSYPDLGDVILPNLPKNTSPAQVIDKKQVKCKPQIHKILEILQPEIDENIERQPEELIGKCNEQPKRSFISLLFERCAEIEDIIRFLGKMLLEIVKKTHDFSVTLSEYFPENIETGRVNYRRDKEEKRGKGR